MHEHDRDLIMALAEGALDGVDRTEAEAVVAACTECSEELSMQGLALDFLSEAPRAGLTEIESHRLHRDLRRQLALEPETQPAPQKRGFNWGRWVAISAAAAVLIGVVAVAPNLDLLGGDSDSAADVALVTSTAAQSATTAAPGLSNTFDRAAAGTEEPAAADAAESAPQTTAFSGLTSTAAPPPTLLDPTDFDAEQYAFFAAAPNLLTLRQTVIDEDAVPDLTRRAVGQLAEDVALLDWSTVNACLVVGIDRFGSPEQALALGAGEFDAAEALFLAYVLDDVDTTIVVAHDATTCAVLGEATP